MNIWRIAQFSLESQLFLKLPAIFSELLQLIRFFIYLNIYICLYLELWQNHHWVKYSMNKILLPPSILMLTVEQLF